jgi:hypothetical protein
VDFYMPDKVQLDDDFETKIARWILIIVFGAGLGFLISRNATQQPAPSSQAIEESSRPFKIPDSLFSDKPLPETNVAPVDTQDEEPPNLAGATIGFGATIGGLLGFMLFISATIRPISTTATESLQTRQAILGALPLPFIGAACGAIIGAMLWFWLALAGDSIPSQLHSYIGAVIGAVTLAVTYIAIQKFVRSRSQASTNS